MPIIEGGVEEEEEGVVLRVGRKDWAQIIMPRTLVWWLGVLVGHEGSLLDYYTRSRVEKDAEAGKIRNRHSMDMTDLIHPPPVRQLRLRDRTMRARKPSIKNQDIPPIQLISYTPNRILVSDISDMNRHFRIRTLSMDNLLRLIQRFLRSAQ